MSTTRKQRANGVVSRQKIIEAALEIASERGYEGTSISSVSERSGLPASSIYWHFRNKDELIAAVIRHSFDQWRGFVPIPTDGADPAGEEAFTAAMRRAGKAIDEAPDFLRLGLMLALERRPEEPAARAMFLAIRRATRDELEAFHDRVFGDQLGEREVQTLGRLAMAAADGLLIAREIDDDDTDLEQMMELFGVALSAVAEHLRDRLAERTARDD